MLYVGLLTADFRATSIAVFDDQASINVPAGTAVAPSRVLGVPAASSFYLDTVNDRLYVTFGQNVRVYDNASTLASGPAAPNRSFSLGTSATSNYIFVDVPNNRLYAVSENVVFIIPNASTADGPGVVGTVVQVQSTGSLFSAVAVKP
jgi:hypothetical protein